MKKRLNLLLVDCYIMSLLIPNLLFSLSICTIICELIGISFEQIKFVFSERLPICTAVLVHFLKLPAFICQALPIALLIATTIVYGQLSAKNEIIALRSSGFSPYRIIKPAIAISLITLILMFSIQELIVPVANYQAAIVLEREWKIDRTQLAKYNKQNIIYTKFTNDLNRNDLEYLFFAAHFDGKQMQDITLLKYQNHYLHKIITARLAQWDQLNKSWQLSNAHQETLNIDGSYASNEDFKSLSLKLDRGILNYANHDRDSRELNLLELYRRLEIVKHTRNRNKIRELKIAIIERYALPCSCIIFAFLGSVLGTYTRASTKSNSLSLAAVATIVYYFTQFIATALALFQAIPIFLGVWFSNLITFFLACYVFFCLPLLEKQSI